MQRVFLQHCLAAVLGLGLAAASASPGAAQSKTGTTPQPGAQQEQGQYSDDDLKAFAVAALEVKRIRETYTPKVEAAETPQARQEISREATDQMVKAVEKHGLSAQRYNAIYSASQNDPGLADRVNEHLRAAE